MSASVAGAEQVMEETLKVMAEKTVDYSKQKKIVLCFDGTGNRFNGDDTVSNLLRRFIMCRTLFS